MRQHSVLVVLHDGVRSLDVTGPPEALAGCGEAGSGEAAGLPDVYRVSTAGPGGRPARTSSGPHLSPDTGPADGGPPHEPMAPAGVRAAAPDPAVVRRILGLAAGGGTDRVRLPPTAETFTADAPHGGNR